MRRTPHDRDRLPVKPRRALRPAPGLALLALLALAPMARAQAPGPERFAKVPTTPLELWAAADYLVRSGQAAQSVPYLRQFVATEPTDAVLLEIREQYGTRSFLRLTDFPETRPYAEPLVARLNEASRRVAGSPERLSAAVQSLPRSPEERAFAIDRLREAGPYAVPALIRGMEQPGLPRGDRALLADALGRLRTDAVPPLLAVLTSGNDRLIADAAAALGRLGDRSAVPGLSYVAGNQEYSRPTRDAAARAIERLTGRAFASQPKPPTRILVDAARAYHLGRAKLPDPLLVWTWDADENAPAADEATPVEAEEVLGLRAARQALDLEPADAEAQEVFVSLALDRAVGRVGLENFPASDPTGAFGTALAAGPAVLGQVLTRALADGKFALAAAAADALARVADRDSLASEIRPHPLARALTSPDRRAQFAAARALVGLEPRRPFLGSSRVVPALARFAGNGPGAGAVVVDGNLQRAEQIASYLRALNFDAVTAATGSEGFRLASESADVELVLLAPMMLQGAWELTDTLANLRADARTAGLPVFIIGPLGVEDRLLNRVREFPGVGFLVTPPNADGLRPQLERGLASLGARPLSDAERERYAVQAAELLGRIARTPGSPFEPDLARAGRALTSALRRPATGQAALVALGDLPDARAQQALADALLDPSQPEPIRLGAATQLAWSAQRFGPLLTGDQERRLLESLQGEDAADPALGPALARVIGSLRPDPSGTGRRLREYRAPAPAGTAEAEGAPGEGQGPGQGEGGGS